MTNLNNNITTQLESVDIVRYSNVWEDYQHSFDIVEHYDFNNILMIASGGENVFNLLAKKSISITAVDANKKQLELIKVKIEAIKKLTREQYISFLGLSDKFDRTDLIAKLDVSDNELVRATSKEGALFVGKLEQYFKTWAEVVSSKYKSFEPLFYQDNNELLDVITNESFKQDFLLLFNEKSLGKGGRDESMYKDVDFDSAEFFWQQYLNAAKHFSNGKSAYFELFNFSTINKSLLPFYLQNDVNFQNLKNNLNNLTLKVGLIDQILDYSNDQFDFAILSNIFEYLSDEQAISLMDDLEKVMIKKSGLLYWNLLKPKKISELSHIWQYQTTQSNAMSEKDRSWYYQDVRFELKNKEGNHA